jgi:hypothetical protein
MLQKISIPDENSARTVMAHVQGSLISYLNSLVMETMNELNILTDKIVPDNHPLILGIKLPDNYKKTIFESVDLFILGYKSTALLVLGKAFEEILTKYLKKLKKANKIDLKTNIIEEMKFDKKLNFLHSIKLIPHKDWLILSKLIWDRNIGGHFVNKKKRLESEKEAGSTMFLVIRLINKYDKIVS